MSAKQSFLDELTVSGKCGIAWCRCREHTPRAWCVGDVDLTPQITTREAGLSELSAALRMCAGPGPEAAAA